MAKGKSGRIVLEVDPILKRHLYLFLEAEQTTLKDWFLASAHTYIAEKKKAMDTDNLLVAERKERYL